MDRFKLLSPTEVGNLYDSMNPDALEMESIGEAGHKTFEHDGSPYLLIDLETIYTIA